MRLQLTLILAIKLHFRTNSGGKIMNFRVFLLNKLLKITKITHFYGIRIGCILGYHFTMKDKTIGALVEHSGIFGPDPGGKNMIFWRI